MQYGVCGGPELAPLLKETGYDFFEWSVGACLKPKETHLAFSEVLKQLETAALPCHAVNCFIPGDLKITGPDVDAAALAAYASTALQRAGQAGIKTVVFGSGGARQIPPDFSRAAAHRQLVDFCRACAGPAQAHGVTVVVEPLNRKECNVLTTVGECGALVREVNQPSVRLLVDAYHWAKDGDSIDDVIANGQLLAHVHIATEANRLAPGAEPFDFTPFFRALRQGGYDGRVSIEGRLAKTREELSTALDLMKTLAAQA